MVGAAGGLPFAMLQRVGLLFVFSVSATSPPPLSSKAARHSHTFNPRSWNKSLHHEVLASCKGLFLYSGKWLEEKAQSCLGGGVHQ